MRTRRLPRSIVVALGGRKHDGLLQRCGARVVGRLILLKHEVARALGRAHGRLSRSSFSDAR